MDIDDLNINDSLTVDSFDDDDAFEMYREINVIFLKQINTLLNDFPLLERELKPAVQRLKISIEAIQDEIRQLALRNAIMQLSDSQKDIYNEESLKLEKNLKDRKQQYLKAEFLLSNITAFLTISREIKF